MEIESSSSSPAETFDLESPRESAGSSSGASSESGSSENDDMQVVPSLCPSCSEAPTPDPMEGIIAECQGFPDSAGMPSSPHDSGESDSPSFGSSSSNDSSPCLPCQNCFSTWGNAEPKDQVSDEISASQLSFGGALDSEENSSQCSKGSVFNRTEISHRLFEAIMVQPDKSRHRNSAMTVGRTHPEMWHSDAVVNLRQDEQEELVEPRCFLPQPSDAGTFLVSRVPPGSVATTLDESSDLDTHRKYAVADEADLHLENAGTEPVGCTTLQLDQPTYRGEDVDLACAALRFTHSETSAVSHLPLEDKESPSGTSTHPVSDVGDVGLDVGHSQAHQACAVVDHHRFGEYAAVQQIKSSQSASSDSDSEDTAFVDAESQASLVGVVFDQPPCGKQDQHLVGQRQEEIPLYVTGSEIINEGALDKRESMKASQSCPTAASGEDCEDEVDARGPLCCTRMTTATPPSTDSNLMLQARKEHDALAKTHELVEHRSPMSSMNSSPGMSAFAAKAHVRQIGLEHAAGDGYIEHIKPQNEPTTCCSLMPEAAPDHQQDAAGFLDMPAEEAVPIPSGLSHTMKHCGHPDREMIVDRGYDDETLHDGICTWMHDPLAWHQQSNDAAVDVNCGEVNSDDDLGDLSDECEGVPWLQPSAMDSLCGHIALFASSPHDGGVYTGVPLVREDVVDLHVWLLTRDHEELLSSALLRQKLGQLQARNDIRESQRSIPKNAWKKATLLPALIDARRNHNNDVAEAAQRVLLAKELIHMLGSKYVSLCEVLSEVLHQQPGLATAQTSLHHQRSCLAASLQACNADIAHLSLELDEKNLQVQQAEDRLRNIQLQMAALSRKAEVRAVGIPSAVAELCKSKEKVSEEQFENQEHGKSEGRAPRAFAGAETSEFLRLRAEVQALRSRCTVRRNLSATFEQAI